MPTLTRKQKEIYEYIKSYIRKNGISPTFEEIKKHFKLKALSGVYQHIDALIDKGFLIKNENLSRGLELNKQEKMVTVPLLGTIAAGQPIEAIEIPDETITVIKDNFYNYNNLYALRVQGNSMIDEGIFDGDIVVLRKQAIANNGEMVVAIIDDNEATLKKLYREKDKFRLQPANPTLFPLYRKEVEVRGVVVKIIRNIEKDSEIKKESNEKYTRRIDYSWDFRGEKTKSYTHGLHTYPAMFIPQVARRLLQNYSKKGDVICDIFCGSGTALIESRLLGRNSYGIDLNPLAIFLAKAKTTAISLSKLQKEYFDLLDRIKKIKKSEIKKPEFPNIDFWFKESIIIELAKIKKAIKKIKNINIQNFFLVGFSETVRLASNTKNGEFKLVRIKEELRERYNPNVLEIFKKKTENNIKAMSEFEQGVDKKTWTKIIFGDSSKDNGIKENSIDFILTSPPYGDSRTTVAYGQFSRLSAQWIDIFEDQSKASKVDNELLGGRAVKELKHSLNSNYLNQTIDQVSKKDEKRAKEVLSFYIDLNKCLKQAHRILKKNKYFSLVIGNRLVKQVRIPTDFIIAELGEEIGFVCEDIIVRNIPGKRMPKKNSPTNISGELEETMNKESIVILKKIK
ncbi:transcriptional repressor LexA [Patescibacteria group bacterium]|nr:transcriptional repressor LexA [Patescibacteria group bacterium]